MATGIAQRATSAPATSETMASTSRARSRATAMPSPPLRAALAARSRAAANLCAIESVIRTNVSDAPALTALSPCGTVEPMAEIELAPLSHRLDEEEMKTLARKLEEAGAPALGRSDEHASHTIAARLSEEALTEFLDRLDAHDLGAEIYLPIEFEGRVSVGDYRVASTQALLDILEEMKEELDVEAEDADEEEEEEEDDELEDEGTVIEAQLRHIWQLVADGATESIDKNLPLHLQV